MQTRGGRKRRVINVGRLHVLNDNDPPASLSAVRFSSQLSVLIHRPTAAAAPPGASSPMPTVTTPGMFPIFSVRFSVVCLYSLPGSWGRAYGGGGSQARQTGAGDRGLRGMAGALLCADTCGAGGKETLTPAFQNGTRLPPETLNPAGRSKSGFAPRNTNGRMVWGMWRRALIASTTRSGRAGRVGRPSHTPHPPPAAKTSQASWRAHSRWSP